MKRLISSLGVALMFFLVVGGLPGGTEAGSVELGWVRDDASFHTMPLTHINVTFNAICNEVQCYRVDMRKCAMMKTLPMLVCATDGVAYRIVPQNVPGSSGANNGKSTPSVEQSAASYSGGSHFGAITAVVICIVALAIVGVFLYYRFVKYH